MSRIDHIDVLGVDDLAQRRARVGRRYGEAIACQILRDRLADVRLVVADDDVRAWRPKFRSASDYLQDKTRLRMRRQINKHRVQCSLVDDLRDESPEIGGLDRLLEVRPLRRPAGKPAHPG